MSSKAYIVAIPNVMLMEKKDKDKTASNSSERPTQRINKEKEYIEEYIHKQL